MAKLVYNPSLVNSAINQLENAKRKLANTEADIQSAISTISNARGIEYVDMGAVSSAIGLSDECLTLIDNTIQGINERVEQIQAYNKEIDSMGFGKRLISTIGLGLAKFTEGVGTAGENIVDGFASGLGFVVGFFSKDAQNRIGDFVKKDHVGTFYNNLYDNQLSGMVKASYMKRDGIAAKVCKFAGTAVGYTVATTLTAGVASSAGVSGLAVSAAVAGIGGVGSGTEAGLQSGLSYNKAFWKGVKTGAVQAALVVGVHYTIKGVKSLKAGKTGGTVVVGETAANTTDDAIAAAGETADDAVNAASEAAAESADDAVNAATEAAAESTDDAARAATEAAAESTDDAARAASEAAGESTDDAARAASEAAGESADDAARAAGETAGESADDAARAAGETAGESADDAARAAGETAEGAKTSESGKTSSSEGTTGESSAKGDTKTEFRQESTNTSENAKTAESGKTSTSEGAKANESVDDPVKQAEQKLQQAKENLKNAETKAKEEFQDLQKKYENGEISKKEFIQASKEVHPDMATSKEADAVKQAEAELKAAQEAANPKPETTEEFLERMRKEAAEKAANKSGQTVENATTNSADDAMAAAGETADDAARVAGETSGKSTSTPEGNSETQFRSDSSNTSSEKNMKELWENVEKDYKSGSSSSEGTSKVTGESAEEAWNEAEQLWDKKVDVENASTTGRSAYGTSEGSAEEIDFIKDGQKHTVRKNYNRITNETTYEHEIHELSPANDAAKTVSGTATNSADDVARGVETAVEDSKLPAVYEEKLPATVENPVTNSADDVARTVSEATAPKSTELRVVDNATSTVDDAARVSSEKLPVVSEEKLPATYEEPAAALGETGEKLPAVYEEKLPATIENTADDAARAVGETTEGLPKPEEPIGIEKAPEQPSLPEPPPEEKLPVVYEEKLPEPVPDPVPDPVPEPVPDPVPTEIITAVEKEIYPAIPVIPSKDTPVVLEQQPDPIVIPDRAEVIDPNLVRKDKPDIPDFPPPNLPERKWKQVDPPTDKIQPKVIEELVDTTPEIIDKVITPEVITPPTPTPTPTPEPIPTPTPTVVVEQPTITPTTQTVVSEYAAIPNTGIDGGTSFTDHIPAAAIGGAVGVAAGVIGSNIIRNKDKDDDDDEDKDKDKEEE